MTKTSLWGTSLVDRVRISELVAMGFLWVRLFSIEILKVSFTEHFSVTKATL